MKNINILKTGIDVSEIKAQLEQFPDDWESQKKMDHVDSMLKRGWMEIDTGVLQLIIGAVRSKEEFVGDSELCYPTPAFSRHTAVINWLNNNGFENFRRCGFLSIPTGSIVGKHIDEGTYYLDKDRLHLSIQGEYEYTVGDETVLVKPGTLLVFNNKIPHGTKNVGDCPRITFVFDVPHDSWNPTVYNNFNLR